MTTDQFPRIWPTCDTCGDTRYTVHECPGDPPNDIADANARLIAQAPAMLAALKLAADALAELAEADHEFWTPGGLGHAALTDARAILRAVEG